eukprot:scaffold193141_cov30-Tisochrysis_lutea.AAC.1
MPTAITEPHELCSGAAERQRVVYEAPAFRHPPFRVRGVKHFDRIGRQVYGGQPRLEQLPHAQCVLHEVVKRARDTCVAPEVFCLSGNVVGVPDVQGNERLRLPLQRS